MSEPRITPIMRNALTLTAQTGETGLDATEHGISGQTMLALQRHGMVTRHPDGRRWIVGVCPCGYQVTDPCPTHDNTECSPVIAEARNVAFLAGHEARRQSKAVIKFNEGDRVYHRQLGMFGTYQGRHNWGTTSPETSSYVQFDNDPAYPDGCPVSTRQLEAVSEPPPATSGDTEPDDRVYRAGDRVQLNPGHDPHGIPAGADRRCLLACLGTVVRTFIADETRVSPTRTMPRARWYEVETDRAAGGGLVAVLAGALHPTSQPDPAGREHLTVVEIDQQVTTGRTTCPQWVHRNAYLATAGGPEQHHLDQLAERIAVEQAATSDRPIRVTAQPVGDVTTYAIVTMPGRRHPAHQPN